MPAAFAHDLYGRRVFEHLDPKIRQLIRKEKECFYLGLHGPDPLFYYRPFERNPVVLKGHRMHWEIARDFFEDGVEKIEGTERRWERDAMKAYLLGFVCHFALDSSLHGFVNRMDRDSAFSHAEIETELDRRLLIREGKDPLHTDLTFHVKDNKIVRMASGRILDLDEEAMSKAIRSMKLASRLFINTRERFKRFLSRFLMMKEMDSLRGMIMHEDPLEGCEEITGQLEKKFYEAIPVGEKLVTSLWQSLEKKMPLTERFDQNYE